MSLTVRGLTKAFGGEAALAGVDLEVEEGQIHALLGPNGSGKSTLIGCLSGRLTPDAGTMALGDTAVERFNPRSAFRAGTAVIYQHFSLIPTLSVTDNIFLGSESKGFGGRVARGRERADVKTLLSQFGADINPDAPVASLSIGQMQLVEIAKAMRHSPRLLVLDEPTAALGDREARALGVELKKLRDKGLSILYVTHLLSEVFEIADRVTVLRDGRQVLSAATDGLRRQDVIQAIAPRGGVTVPEQRNDRGAAGQPALTLKGFMARGVGPIDLTVRTGEVVGIIGLLGSGRSELLEGVYGIGGRVAGEVWLFGDRISPRSPGHSLCRGLALVPADRGRQSVFADLSALDNLLFPYFAATGRSLLRSRSSERRSFTQTGGLLRLKPARAKAAARTYSGGNQQKLVVGRWLTDVSNVRMLMLDEPTQGIDVGARADLYRLIREFAADPKHGVLFTSSDPEEVQALADRVLVLVRGQLTAELVRSQITSEQMLGLIHGSLGNDGRSRGTHVD